VLASAVGARAPKAAAVAAETPFQAILRQVFQQTQTSGGELASAGKDTVPGATKSVLDGLGPVLGALEPEAVLKLRTLMVAGRDGQSLVAAHAAMAPSDADAVAAAKELSSNASLLGDYLRQGHAIACATGFDLEKPLAEWPSAATHTLDERAWLSFGRQLAKSSPDDWKCLGVVDPQRTEQLTKLYVRLGDLAWWSFQAVLDRPSMASVELQKRALTRRRSKGVANGPLSLIADRSCAAEGRALRRAVKAIRARIGATSAAP
jgi:hypothetical protein